MRGHIPGTRAILFTKKVMDMLTNAAGNADTELTLYEQIEEAKGELSRLYCRFDYENDPDRMDEIIFLLCAAESKYSALMEKARRKAS